MNYLYWKCGGSVGEEGAAALRNLEETEERLVTRWYSKRMPQAYSKKTTVTSNIFV
jgi:hypothetical protein